MLFQISYLKAVDMREAAWLKMLPSNFGGAKLEQNDPDKHLARELI